MPSTEAELIDGFFKEILRCTERSVSPVSRCVVIVDLNGVFVLFRLLNDRSAVQLVTGRVQSMLANARMLGNIELACLRAAGQDGRLLCPWSLSWRFQYM